MTEPTQSALIAVVEDEEHLAQGLLFNLQAEGFRTHHESDGDAALAYLLAAPQSGPDSFAITRALRGAQHYTPILMLTARARPEDVLEGIEAGADDYLPKPFDLNILIVRIKSLLRRTAWQAEQAASPADAPGEPTQADTYAFNHRTIRFDALELIAPNRITQLTVMEADLLRFLTDREGQIVSRKDILEQVWRVQEDTDTRAIDN